MLEARVLTLSGTGKGIFHLVNLFVGAFDLVSIIECPCAHALGLVIVETALEEAAVGVDPLALHHLALHEHAHVLLAGTVKHIGAFAVLLALGPVARVHIVVLVGHDALAVALVLLPVPVVGADHAAVLVAVDLLADAVLHAVLPLAFVGDGRLLV